MKINEKIDEILRKEAEDKAAGDAQDKLRTYYSYEYFPPKTPAGEENLVDRIGRMATTNPLWVDLTWGAGGSTCDTTLEMCGHIQQFIGLDTLMHLTCTGLTREKLIDVLNKAKEYGIRNILALRGDPPAGVDNWVAVDNGFAYAYQLVEFIKENFGDYFCIVVAGYPEMHPLNVTSYEDEIKFLKQKQDAGATCVITQLFYDAQIYLKWVKDCRAAGITAHIIPGIMPIFGYDRFYRTVGFCKTKVPQFLKDSLEPIKSDDEKCRNFGVEYGIKMGQELIDGGERFIHWYTMNLEASVVKIIKGLGILNQERHLPFYKGNSEQRKSENVRPIFWANKPTSYHQRTLKWDEFPNGRWGDSKSPAFGGGFDNEEIGGGFMSYSRKFLTANIPDKVKAWGESVTSLSQVSEVFSNYINGKIKRFPFSEGQLAPETNDLTDILTLMNQNKMLTLNSQPMVNGAKSNDEKYGWGPDNGYVYQKAYFELFIDQSIVEALCSHLDQYPTISYQAINNDGKKLQNVEDNDVNAVTWGVFKGKEIIQPTIVDHEAFMIWKQEALNVFTRTWAQIYKPHKTEKGEDKAGSPESVEFLEKLTKNLFVMNIVENDFIEGDLNKIITEFIQKNQEAINAL